MKIHISSIGKSKRGPEKELSDKYISQVKWEVTFQESEVKRQMVTEKRKLEESLLLRKSIPEHSVKIVLDERGKVITSPQFANFLQEKQDSGYNNFVFLIGGADGHDKEIVNEADMVLSFGKMVWPHQLVTTLP